MQNALYPHSCSILLLIDQNSRDTVPLMYLLGSFHTFITMSQGFEKHNVILIV